MGRAMASEEKPPARKKPAKPKKSKEEREEGETVAMEAVTAVVEFSRRYFTRYWATLDVRELAAEVRDEMAARRIERQVAAEARKRGEAPPPVEKGRRKGDPGWTRVQGGATGREDARRRCGGRWRA